MKNLGITSVSGIGVIPCHSRSPRQNLREKEGGVFKRFRNRGKSVFACSANRNQRSYSRYTRALSENEDSGGGHWKSRSKKKKSNGRRTTCPSRGYDDLKKAFLENYLQQKKCIKDPIEIHNIKQRDGKSTEDFVKRYKVENRDVKGAPECMRISRFVQGITNPKLIKRLYDKIPKTVDEMIRVTTSFLKGKWQPRIMNGRSRFHYGNNKRNNKKEQPKAAKKGETFRKDKALAILMVQSWEIVAKQRITQSFSPNSKISFPPLGDDEGTEGLMIIEAEIEGHCIHRMYVDGGSTSAVLYEHCFSRLHLKIKNQLVPAIPPLIGFSGEIIWPTGQIQLLVKIGDEEHSTSAWISWLRSHYSKEQQDDLARMCDGLRIKREPSNYQANSRRKNQGDAYKGYHQIQMAKEDEEKTAFITSQRIFCYTKMPSGLRNARATYQRLVDKAFHKQIGRNLEVYVDGLVIKSHMKDEIVRDIEETFKTLRKINMKLSPKKCTFGVEEGTFLGYKNVEKTYEEKYFHWTVEAEEAFKQMKQLVAELLMLVAPMEKEELIVYLEAAKETILSDFIVERPEEDTLVTLMEMEEELPEPWITFTYESSCTDGSGVGLILTNPEGMEFTYALRFRFGATNNEAEYEALIAGLRITEQMGVKNLQANVDS
nr:reverse transcriptase domain-containing protein [Tanacetum cinerariifolium]